MLEFASTFLPDWVDVKSAGGSFVSGGYNTTISTQTDSPIAGRAAWTGNSGGYITTIVDLPLQWQSSLRWRMATDNGQSGQGWRIDNVSITKCRSGIPTQTPTPTPTATPTSTPVSYNYATVSTIPEGLAYQVNGVTYNSTQVFQVAVPGSLILSAVSPQAAGEGSRYVWKNWSNGGDFAHVMPLQYPGSSQFAATYKAQHLLTMEERPCQGNISPETAYYDAGQNVQLRAFNLGGSGLIFSSWKGTGTGSYTGPLNPVLIQVNGPIRQEPLFVPATVTPTPSPTPAYTPRFDYDGDLRSDISVYRPSEGTWYTMLSGSGTFYGLQFGISTDKINPADYDGDGMTDIAVYRPEIGYWFILNSSDGTFRIENFGLLGDLPQSADYDGDGKADLAVFRPSNGNWYVRRSTNGTTNVTHFGLNGDKPTVGDFDGDRKADIAVYRPSTNTWHRTCSSCGAYVGEDMGSDGDKVAPADYDGDGKTDIAIYSPASGLWRIKKTSTLIVDTFQWGIAEDIPVPGEYDGDGKADIAVFRPSTGYWYIANSSDGGYPIYQFGQSGDIPTQSAFGN